MLEIHRGLLWIGGSQDLTDLRKVFDAGVRSVVDLAIEEQRDGIPRDRVMCRFPINDGAGNDSEIVCAALHTIRTLLDLKISTLVACSAGLSRSPTIAAFGLALFLREAPDDVIARIADQKALQINAQLWREVSAAYAKIRAT